MSTVAKLSVNWLRGDMKRRGGNCGGVRPNRLGVALLVETVLVEVGLVCLSLLAGDLELEDLLLLFLRQPPPTGTLRRAPPLVQYLLQVLQKWRG